MPHFTEAEYQRIAGKRAVPPPKAKAGKVESPHEVELERQLTEAGIDGWRREHIFHPERKWRVDFAWPALRVAVEVEGAVHRIKGRYSRDIEKYNALALRDWLLVRVTPKMIGSGQALETVREALDVRPPP